MITTMMVPIGGAQISVERVGNGDAIVFLHAGVCDKRMWNKQVAELSDRFQTVSYDRRGFGSTVTTNEAFSNVDDLRALLAQLEISSAVLVGCSQGAKIAIDFALLFPQRVRRLVLISPAVSGAPSPDVFPAEIQSRLDALKEAESANDLERVNVIEANLWLDGPLSAEGRVRGPVRALFLEMNAIALRMPALTLEIEPISAYERLTCLDLPVLVIWGELDFPHINERCRYLVATIANAKGIQIAGAAHLPNLEHAEQINLLLRDFSP